MAKIEAPNKNYNGISASIEFVDGVGHTGNKDLLSWFKEKGYKVIDDKEPVRAKKSSSKKE